MSKKHQKDEAGKLPEGLKKLLEREEPYSAKEIAEVEEKIYIARCNFLMRQPFFGLMAMHMKLVDASSWLMTAATDGRNFYYNVGFFNMLTPAEIQFVYGHEILHVAYDHFGRAVATTQDLDHYVANGMTFDEKARLNAQLANIAADYCVNRDLVEYKVGTLIRKEVIELFYDKKFDDKIMEEVYMELLKDPDMAKKGSVLDDHGVGTGTKGDGSHRKANPENEPDFEKKGQGSPADMSDEEKEAVMREFREKMINAYDQQKEHEQSKKDADMPYDPMPAELERLINRLRKSEINWRTYIRRRITALFRETDDWSRPSRRSFDGDFIMPGFRNVDKVDIHIAIDCSGSISEVEMADFLSEISGISRQFKDYVIRIWTFDGDVYEKSFKEYRPHNIHLLPKYQFFGGGGTSFLANWAFMKAKNIKPKLFIMFTDGYTGDGYGIEGYCDTLYVVNTDCKIPEKYGSTIRYKPKRLK